MSLDAREEKAGPDLGDPGYYRSGPPHPYWARVRDAAPVHRLRSRTLNREFWLVTGHAAVREALLAPGTFTSRYGIFPGARRDAPDPAAGRSVEVTEGERHRFLRSVLRPHFSPRRYDQLTEECSQVLARHALPHVGTGLPYDFADVAQRISMKVFARLIRVPHSDLDHLTQSARTLQFPQFSNDREAAGPAPSRIRAESLGYFVDLVHSRQKTPPGSPPDVADTLVSHIETGALTEVDAATNLHTVLTSTNETVRLSLAAMPILFARWPDQLELLKARPELVRLALEEILRWTSPLMYLTRIATRDTWLGDAHISADEPVMLALAAANRDPEVFRSPDRFDITRAANPHVTFGHGLHHCLGAALARAELTAGLEFFMNEVSSITVAGPLESVLSHTFSGFEHVPVVLEAPSSRPVGS